MNRQVHLGKILLLTSVLAFSSVQAEENRFSLGIICCSYHFDAGKDYNELNFGGIVKYQKSHGVLLLGRYRNSYYRYSNFIAAGPQWNMSKNVQFSLPIGLVTGYKDDESLFTPLFSDARVFMLPTFTFDNKIAIHYMPGVMVAVSGNIYTW